MQFWRTILERDWGRFEMIKMQPRAKLGHSSVRNYSIQKKNSTDRL